MFFTSSGSGAAQLYQGNVGADNKPHGAELDKGSAEAVQAWAGAVAKATGVSPIIPDVANGLYNRYVLGTPT